MGLLSKFRAHFSRLDVVLGWIERVWGWLPTPVRAVIGAGVGLVMAGITGVLTTLVVFVGNFATDYWPIVLLTMLASAAAGTQVAGLGNRLVAAMNRLADSRTLSAAQHSPGALADLVALNDVRELTRNHAEHASDVILRIAGALMGDGLNKKAFASSFKKEITGLREATGVLRGSVDDEHPADASTARQGLVTFHREYMDVVTGVHMAELEGFDLVEDYDELYAVWEERHGEYLVALKAKESHAELAPIRGQLRQIGYDDARAKRWSTAYAKAWRIVENPSREQGDFLMSVFASEHYQPTWGDKPMPLDVYRAGEALVELGILRSSRAGTRVDFTLPRPTGTAWSFSGALIGPTTRLGSVDLLEVEGTGASGSGATRSTPRIEELSRPKPEEEGPGI